MTYARTTQEKKSKRVTFRLTEEEWERLDDEGIDRDCNIVDLIREALKKEPYMMGVMK